MRGKILLHHFSILLSVVAIFGTLPGEATPVPGKYTVIMAVKSDPTGLASLINMPAQQTLTLERVDPPTVGLMPGWNLISLPSEPSNPWIDVSGTVADDGSASFTGKGNVADSFLDIAVNFEGNFLSPSQLVGDYTIGAEGGLSGALPIIYSLEGQLSPAVVFSKFTPFLGEYLVTVSVKSDTAGHGPFVGAPSQHKLTVTETGDIPPLIKLTSDTAYWVTSTALEPIQIDIPLRAEGRGTVAGFPGIKVVSGWNLVPIDGIPTLTGENTMGAEGGLPQAQSIIYDIQSIDYLSSITTERIFSFVEGEWVFSSRVAFNPAAIPASDQLPPSFGLSVSQEPVVGRGYWVWAESGSILIPIVATGRGTVTHLGTWMEVRGPVAADGSFTASGQGNLPGFPDVGIKFEGKVSSGQFVGDYTIEAGGSLLISYRLEGTPAPEPPTLPANSVVNGGSFRAATDPNGAIAPGAIVAIFGTGLASDTQVATAVPLPLTLRDTSVTFNDIPAPLFFVSGTQINAQVPFEMPSGTVSVVVKRGDASAVQTVSVADVSPGIFTLNQQGTGTGAILHAVDFQPVSESAPAQPGEFLLIFCTGLGPVQPEVASGQIAPSTEPLARTVSLPMVNIAAIAADVTFSGLAPGFVGLYQVNVQVPAGVPAGTQEVEIIIDGVPSNTVTIAVQ